MSGELKSRGDAGAEAAGRNYVFATTHWSVVLNSRGSSAKAAEALEKLCRAYWWPLYGFVRREGYSPEEAQDLTQGFFQLLLQRKDFDKVRQEKGRLRSYLLTALKNFLGEAHRRLTTMKRGSGEPLVALDELLLREQAEMETGAALSPDRIYERRWATILLEEVLNHLEEEYRQSGRSALFAQLKELLIEDPQASSHGHIAAGLGMTENAVRQAFFRLRERYRALLQLEIANTVATPEDVEEEVRHLIAVLQT
jgi:RNA polymerase sigma-70 factor (ECF subfamily)